MAPTISTRIKSVFRKIWEVWSTVQDQQDEVYRSETGIGEAPIAEKPVAEDNSCNTAATEKESTDLDISDLIKKRKEEFARSQSKDKEDPKA